MDQQVDKQIPVKNQGNIIAFRALTEEPIPVLLF